LVDGGDESEADERSDSAVVEIDKYTEKNGLRNVADPGDYERSSGAGKKNAFLSCRFFLSFSSRFVLPLGHSGASVLHSSRNAAQCTLYWVPR
jgi:hypothetical protein